MYNASSAFHQAVQNDEPQIALLIFDDAVFSNSDINVQNGIEFHDYFNTEEDIAIGQALSNEIRFTLFNDERLLNLYEFGEFKALLGVRISKETYSDNAKVIAYDGNVAWRGNNTSPYLSRNRVAVSVQPNFPVLGIIVYDGKVYAIGGNGQYKTYNSDGTEAANMLNEFMEDKTSKFIGIGAELAVNDRILKMWSGGSKETYEFVPLGTFIAERPDSPDQISISLTCYDRMKLFDKDMPDSSDLSLYYPTTIGGLFVALCNYVGVPYRTATFLNSDVDINKEPEAFKNAKMRTVIGWIAEAAASNAGLDRDGYLVMKWLNTTETVINESGYESCVPKYYQTPKVTKLCKRQTNGDADAVYGSGGNAYLIQDNPLL